MSTIRITVELVDADFRKDYDVDPDEPLSNLVIQVAEEEGVPLRTRQGRPLAWTAEGPEWRGGKEGWTDYVRTQPLAPVAEEMRARHGDRSPLFEVRIDIPGAGEALHEGREAAKREEIARRLAEREAERRAELGPLADQVEMMDASIVEEELETEPPGADSRIRRAGAAGAGAAIGLGVAAGAAEGRIRRKGADASGGKKKAAPKKPAGGKKKAATARPAWFVPAVAGGAGLLVVGLLVAVVALSGGEPEPAPTPTPAPVVEDVPVDMPMATPTPAPPKVEATPTPIPMVVFYSKGEVTRTGAKAAGAQLSSFARPDVRLDYTATGSGGHSVTLKNRFTVTVGPNGGSFEGASSKAIPAQTVAPQTRMQVHYDGANVTVRVGRKRYGPWPAKASGGFPAWQFTMDPDVTFKGLSAASQSTE